MNNVTGSRDSALKRPAVSKEGFFKKGSKVAEQPKPKIRAKKRQSTDSVGDLDQDPQYKDLMALLKNDGIHGEEKLGAGSYSVVSKAVCTGSVSGKPKQVAIKVIGTKEKSDYTTRFLPSEMKIVMQLNHPNILRFYSVKDFRSDEKLLFVVFVTEWAAGGDLLQKIKALQAISKAKGLTESDMKITFRQLIEALNWMGQKCIVHRDLKCENIMLDVCENVKIGDFGFARVIQPNEKSNTFCGSRAYLAPEMSLLKFYYGRPANVWSVGIIMFVSTTGHFSFDDSNPERMVANQLAHKVQFSSRWNGSKQLKQIIIHTLEPISDKRPSYTQMMAMDFLKDTPLAQRNENVAKSMTLKSPY